MRKVISLVLVAAMLVCGMMIVPTSSAAEATLDDYNVAAEAYRFDGSVSYKVATGNCAGDDSNPFTVTDAFLIKDDGTHGYNRGDMLTDYKTDLILDGNVTAAEWGDPVVVVSSKYAPTNTWPDYGLNTEYETPSAENTYYYHRCDSNKKDLAPEKGLQFSLYLMWDDDYLYVAAKTTDNDQHNNGNSGETLYDADAFQFRVDTLGPNSEVNGSGYDAKGYPNVVEPWKDVVYDSRHWAVNERVCNFVFGYTAQADGMTEMWDASLRYLPEYKEGYVDADGNPLLVYNQHDVRNDYFEFEYDYDGIGGDEGIYGMVYPRKRGSSTSANAYYETAYEFAIPWDLIEKGYTPEVGSELGVAAALFNAAPGQSAYNSALGWGTGIIRDQMRYNPQTAGGSNSLILSDASYKTSRCTHPTFTEATCEAPETCTECGYQRGYKAGHKFEYDMSEIPTATDNGYITATCTVCNKVENVTVEPGKTDVIHSFTTSDTTIVNKGFNSGFTAAWRTTNSTDETTGVRNGPTIFKPDNTIKNSFDDTIPLFPGEAVVDLYNNGSAIATVDSDVNNADQTGTYFDMDSMTTTYTYAMEVYFPDLNDLVDHKYNAGVRNWVGDPTKYGFYGVGLFRVQGEYFFAIIDQTHGEGTGFTIEEFKENALQWAPATAKDLETGVWHSYAMAFDEKTGTAMFAWDGELKVAASDYHLKYNNSSTTPFFRRFNLGLYVKNIQAGGLGLFSNYIVEKMYEVNINGEISLYTKRAEAAYSTPETKMEDGKIYIFSKWTGDVDKIANFDIYSAEGTFKMPGDDVTLTAEYTVFGDIDGDGAVNMEDSAILKNILLGNLEATEAADINGDGSVNTKDAFIIKQIMVGEYTID